MWSWSAAMRFGTNWTGTTTRARTGALTTWFLLGFSNRLLGQRHDLAESQREVEGRVGDRAEVGVGARLTRLFVGDDREVDLLALGLIGHGSRVVQYFLMTPTTTPWTCTWSASTMIGCIAGLAGWRRTRPFSR